jgi:hypothetical protein
MQELFFYTTLNGPRFKDADNVFGLRLHSNKSKFIVMDTQGDNIAFNNFDDALKHAKNDGYEPSEKEISKFLAELVLNREDVNEFNLGKFELFKQMLNPIVLKVVQKYGIDSKQAKAVLKLYKD